MQTRSPRKFQMKSNRRRKEMDNSGLKLWCESGLNSGVFCFSEINFLALCNCNNRFLGEAIDHSHLDARKGHWQVDAHPVGGAGTTPLPAGEQ